MKLTRHLILAAGMVLCAALSVAQNTRLSTGLSIDASGNLLMNMAASGGGSSVVLSSGLRLDSSGNLMVNVAAGSAGGSVTVNGGSAITSPNFQNGTSGNLINFTNPASSNVQATLQNASGGNLVLASPNGSTGATTYRALVIADLCGGTGATAGTFLIGNCTWGNSIATMNVTSAYQVGGVALASTNLGDTANIDYLNTAQTFSATKTFTTSLNVTSSGGGTLTVTSPSTSSNPTITLPAGTGQLYDLTGTVNLGGIPCFSSTTNTQESSTATLTSNVLVKGGGSGGCPANSLATDSGSQLSYSGTSLTVGGSGVSALELQVTGNNSVNSWTTTGVGLILAGSTYNDATGTGTIAKEVIHGVAAPLISTTNGSVTITQADTFYIAGPPTATGGNVTITNGVSLEVATGVALFGGVVQTPTVEASAIGGAVSLCGGKCTGTQNATLGAITMQGSDNSNTGASAIPGAATVRGGNLTGAATNGVGGVLTLASGLGTGNGTPAQIKLQSPSFSTTSGTTAQTLVTNYTVHKKAGSTSSATATNMFNIAVATNQTIGVTILVHVETTQATPQNCSTTEQFVAAVQNTSSTVTSQVTAGTIATICSTGTLTLTAAFSSATPSVFSVTPSWTTIVPTGVIISITILNDSQQDVTFL